MAITKEQAAAVKDTLAVYLRAQSATLRARTRAATILNAAAKHEAESLAAYRAAAAVVGETDAGTP